MADYPQMDQHSGPVAGYPRLTASNADTDHVSSRVLGGLESIAERYGAQLTIISGYRSPGYSAAVGGYSTDPHSRGVACDVYVGSMTLGEYLRSKGLDPVAVCSAVGLESGDQPGFYRGSTDPEHVQIPGSGVNKSIVDYGGGGGAGTVDGGQLPDAGGGGVNRPDGEPAGSGQDVSIVHGPLGGAVDIFGKVFGGLWHGATDIGSSLVQIARGIAALVHFVTDLDNWLRLVEFLAGMGLIAVGLSVYLKVFTGSETPTPAKVPKLPVPVPIE